jgi:hypothetical protein
MHYCSDRMVQWTVFTLRIYTRMRITYISHEYDHYRCFTNGTAGEGSIEVFTAMLIMVFLVVTPCSDVGYQGFGGQCCLHLQGSRRYPTITLHDVETQKTTQDQNSYFQGEDPSNFIDFVNSFSCIKNGMCYKFISH